MDEIQDEIQDFRDQIENKELPKFESEAQKLAKKVSQIQVNHKLL